MDTYPHKNSQENLKINKKDKPFRKDKFIFNLEKKTYICPIGQTLENQITLKNNPRTIYWTNNCKIYSKQHEYCEKKIITD